MALLSNCPLTRPCEHLSPKLIMGPLRRSPSPPSPHPPPLTPPPPPPPPLSPDGGEGRVNSNLLLPLPLGEGGHRPGEGVAGGGAISSGSCRKTGQLAYRRQSSKS